jgi:hypothetical protein
MTSVFVDSYFDVDYTTAVQCPRKARLGHGNGLKL